ncbi:MAG TPA: nicotinate-nucleotide adenylyltransferase [Phycisphaerae bacterium]|nr:nicotinate-nucleotide adenylyltransferase [Phycisphaerae bacterium]
MRIALFGGSFDPIHHGHLIVARAVAEQLDIARVILLPSRTPPHKPHVALAPPEHRLAMVQAAIAGDDLFAASDHDLTCAGPSYTVNTVAHFRRTMPDAELCWIVGGDSLRELHTWYQPDEITRNCRVVTAVRPGYEVGDLPELAAILPAETVAHLRRDVLETPRIDISATQVRERVAAHRPIRYLVPAPVATYIQTHQLYA